MRYMGALGTPWLTCTASIDTTVAAAAKPTIKVTFVKPSGEKVVVDAPIGDSMLEVAHANNIDIEGGAAWDWCVWRWLGCTTPTVPLR